MLFSISNTKRLRAITTTIPVYSAITANELPRRSGNNPLTFTVLYSSLPEKACPERRRRAESRLCFTTDAQNLDARLHGHDELSRAPTSSTVANYSESNLDETNGLERLEPLLSSLPLTALWLGRRIWRP